MVLWNNPSSSKICSVKNSRFEYCTKSQGTNRIQSLRSGLGTKSDTKQKREEVLTLVESMNPEALPFLAGE